MGIFEFLLEMSGELPYEYRKVKGSMERQKTAAQLVEQERQDWLSTLEIEI